MKPSYIYITLNALNITIFYSFAFAQEQLSPFLYGIQMIDVLKMIKQREWIALEFCSVSIGYCWTSTVIPMLLR